MAFVRLRQLRSHRALASWWREDLLLSAGLGLADRLGLLIPGAAPAVLRHALFATAGNALASFFIIRLIIMRRNKPDSAKPN